MESNLHFQLPHYRRYHWFPTLYLLQRSVRKILRTLRIPSDIYFLLHIWKMSWIKYLWACDQRRQSWWFYFLSCYSKTWRRCLQICWGYRWGLPWFWGCRLFRWQWQLSDGTSHRLYHRFCWRYHRLDLAWTTKRELFGWSISDACGISVHVGRR